MNDQTMQTVLIHMKGMAFVRSNTNQPREIEDLEICYSLWYLYNSPDPQVHNDARIKIALLMGQHAMNELRRIGRKTS